MKASFVQKKCVIPKRIIQLRHCRMILSKHLGARVCSIWLDLRAGRPETIILTAFIQGRESPIVLLTILRLWHTHC